MLAVIQISAPNDGRNTICKDSFSILASLLGSLEEPPTPPKAHRVSSRHRECYADGRMATAGPFPQAAPLFVHCHLSTVF